MSQPAPPSAHADAELILRAFERLARSDRKAASRLLRVLRGMLSTATAPGSAGATSGAVE